MPRLPRLPLMALLLASAVGVQSCASNDRLQLPSPPATDLKSKVEPAFPPQALEETDAGRAAEQSYNDDVLTWGRGLKLQVDRLCRWWTNAGGKLPFRCPVPPQ